MLQHRAVYPGIFQGRFNKRKRGSAFHITVYFHLYRTGRGGNVSSAEEEEEECRVRKTGLNFSIYFGTYSNYNGVSTK